MFNPAAFNSDAFVTGPDCGEIIRYRRARRSNQVDGKYNGGVRVD